MDEKKGLLKNILGLNNTTSLAIGLPVTGFGLVASLLTKYPDYNEITKDQQAQINQIPIQNEKRIGEIEAGFSADMAGYGANVQKGAQESLVNRGITDPGVSQAVASNVKAGLSGAYAAAHGALARAKVNAQISTNNAMVNYKMGLAQRQYDATMAEYAAKNGIWGALGGLGTGIMGLKSDEVPSKSALMMDNPKLNLDILGGK